MSATRIAALLLSLGFGTAACHDLPTSSAPPAGELREQRFPGAGPETASHGRSRSACLLSERSEGGPHRYRYRRVRGIQLPRSAEAADGETTVLRLTFQAPGEPVFAQVNCRVPNTPAAVALIVQTFVRAQGTAGLLPLRAPSSARLGEMSYFVDPKRRGLHGASGAAAAPGGGPLMDTGCVSAGSCTLPGITVYSYPPPSYTDPYGTCYWGCGWNASAGDYGGGDYYDPGTPPEDDRACNTGDPVLDSQAVQQGMADLWARSNPNGDMAQRLEKGGWVIINSSGFAFQPFPDSWTLGPCGIDAPANTVPPQGAIAWVHTHPYSTGELLTSCEADMVTIQGRTFTAYTKYGNDPSTPDGETSTRWNLPGLVIDKNKITEFVGDPNSANKFEETSRVNRCGY